MRNLLSDRRGSVALATVIALVPLIGALALGAEAGTWYVTKQRAQTAADAAAYSGGLKLACTLAGSSCVDAQSVEYRGKQFAAQNTFCNAGDSSYPGAQCTSVAGVTRTVAISTSGKSVTATVGHQQPAYLAALLGLSTVNIAASATAEVKVLATPCALSLQNPIAFQGSATVSAPGCGLASNSTAPNAIDFTGNGLDVSHVGSISAQGGCKQTGGSPCSKTITYAPPVPNPLAGLDAPMASLTTASFSGGACGTTAMPTPYDAGHRCYNLAGNGASRFRFENATYALNGVYFFSGNVSVNGSAIITGTATLVLLPGSTLSINGGATIQLSPLDAVTTTQVPVALSSVVNLMSKLLIYDPEVTTGNQTVSISGNSSSYFNGITYAPNANVTYQGSTQSYKCVEVIAKGITFSGNSNFDNSECPASSKVETHIVKLVQ